MSRLATWQRNNGLDYPGWWRYLIRRRWRHTPILRCLLPFDMGQEDYDNGLQTIWITEWGKTRWEIWRWPPYRDRDICSRLWHRLSRRTIYAIIQSEARLITRAATYSDIR